MSLDQFVFLFPCQREGQKYVQCIFTGSGMQQKIINTDFLIYAVYWTGYLVFLLLWALYCGLILILSHATVLLNVKQLQEIFQIVLYAVHAKKKSYPSPELVSLLQRARQAIRWCHLCLQASS